MTDIALVVLLIVVASSLLWIEWQRLSTVVAAGGSASTTGGYYWRLSRQAGLSPVDVWPIFVGAKVVGAALVPLLLMEVTGVSLPVTLIAAPLGFFAPDLVLASIRRSRKRQIRRHLSYFLDLLLSLVQAGLGLEEAFALAAREGLPREHPLADEALLLVEELGLGRERTEGFTALADRTGVDELRSLANAIALALSVGMSLETTLKAQADLARAKRREEGMARVQVASAEVLLPLVLCSFPVFAVLVVAPLGIQIWQMLEQLRAVLRS